MSSKVIKIVFKCLYILTVLVLIYILSVKLSKGKTVITANSSLIGTTSVEELYVMKFNYGGISYYIEGKENEYLDEKERTKADLKIKYNANVYAKINLEEIEKNKRIDGKKIYLKLPKIQYEINILSDNDNENNQKNFEIIGSQKERYTFKSYISNCEVDARNEIENNKEIKKSIIDTAKSSVEGLIYPKIINTKYKIVWEDEK